MKQPINYYMCSNEKCKHYMEARAIWFTKVGDDLWMPPGTPVCECNPSIGLPLVFFEVR